MKHAYNSQKTDKIVNETKNNSYQIFKASIEKIEDSLELVINNINSYQDKTLENYHKTITQILKA